MTRRLLPPTLDLETLERDIATKVAELNIDEAEVLTNSQALLKDTQERVVVLDKAGRLRRSEISRLRKMISDLQSVLTRMEAVESDNEIERQAQLAQIDTLRKAGVNLPE